MNEGKSLLIRHFLKAHDIPYLPIEEEKRHFLKTYNMPLLPMKRIHYITWLPEKIGTAKLVTVPLHIKK